MKLRWNSRFGAQANARTRLPRMVAEYFALGREVTARDDAPAAELHGFRLATKRLRYTLELFRPCYGRGLEARLDELRSIQQYLGDANDCAATRRIAEKLLPPGEERRKVGDFLSARAAADASRFRTHWRERFDAPGRERAWSDYFARSGRRRVQ